MDRLKRRVLILIGTALLALLFWKVGQSRGWLGTSKCEDTRIEEKDASGKVVKITSKTCVS